MEPLTWSAIAGASLAGSFIQTVTGFGYGIFVMMFFPYFLETPSASAMSGMTAMLVSLTVALSLRRHIAWRTLVVPVCAAMVTSAVAVYGMKSFHNDVLTLALGIVLVLLSVYFFFFSSKIHLKPSLMGGILAGALSGVLSGLFGMGGPPVVVYFLGTCEDDPKRYAGTIHTFFVITNIYNTVIKAVAGYVTLRVLTLWPFALIGMLVGTFVGKLVFGKLNVRVLKKAVYGFMAISGVIDILSVVL